MNTRNQKPKPQSEDLAPFGSTAPDDAYQEMVNSLFDFDFWVAMMRIIYERCIQ